MADSNDKDALTFRLGSVSTKRLVCERSKVLSEARAGKFRTTVELESSQEEGADLEVAVEMTVTVEGVQGEGGDTALKVMCVVDSILKFNHPHSDELTGEVLDFVGMALFHTALERSRQIISTMGFPGHTLSASMPRFAPAAERGASVNIKVTKEKEPTSPKSGVRARASVASKSSAKKR